MIARAFAGLCLRPALLATGAILAAFTGAIVFVESALGDAGGPSGARIFFVAYHVLAAALLISLGSFASKVTAELAALRLARTVPGLRRKIRASLLVLVPVVAAGAAAFLRCAVPAPFEVVSFAAQASVGVFLFCLGLGLGRSWLFSVVVMLLIGRLEWIGESLRTMPVMLSLGALAGAAVLVAMWSARFLPRGDRERTFWRLARLEAPAVDALARRTGERLADAADWSERSPRLTLATLLKAGAHERFGHRFGKLPGALAGSVVGVHALVFVLAAALAAKTPGLGLRAFCERLFTLETPDPWTGVARVAFAALTGMAGYIGAVMFDTSLRPDLWHPLSRRLKARALFASRLRQNACFACAHAAAALLMLLGFGALAGKAPGASALRAFLLPALLTFLLAPIPQALFPHGADTFHARANPLIQLGAGLLGGAFCLLTVYWTAHALTTAWHAVAFVAGAALVYAGYWACVNFRYTRVDLSRRAL